MNNEPNNFYNTLRDLIETVTLLRKELEDIRATSKDSSIVLAHQRGELSNLEDKFSRLQRLVIEGDVNPSLITQVKVMENTISVLTEQLKDQQGETVKLINELKEDLKRSEQEEREDNRIKLDNWLQALAGIAIALITFLLTNILGPKVTDTLKDNQYRDENINREQITPKRRKPSNTD
jgi:hypothetical protein